MSPSSVIPKEVIIEILRSSELDQSTLATCCLLSRTHLDSARKWLYCDIGVRLNTTMEKGIYGEDMVFWEFTKSTAKLIETVQGSKELRKMIRTLNFHTLPYYPGDPVSGVRTSLGHAIEPFLMQGCNPQSLGFDDHERECRTCASDS